MSFSFKIEFKNSPSTIKSQIDNKFGEAESEFIDRVEKTYGSQYVNENMFESGIVFKNKRKMFTDGAGADKKLISRLGRIYEEIWEEKYEAIQAAHKGYAQSAGYIDDEGLTAHLRRKKRNAGQQASHAPAKVKFESENPWTIWTGLFRDKVGKAFTEDFSNEYLEITNLLIAGGFKMIGEGFPHMYDTFTQWFQDKGIIEDQPFDDEDVDWNKIGNIMGVMAEANFVDPFIDIFNKLDIKV